MNAIAEQRKLKLALKHDLNGFRSEFDDPKN